MWRRTSNGNSVLGVLEIRCGVRVGSGSLSLSDGCFPMEEVRRGRESERFRRDFESLKGITCVRRG